jgi:hypothetical protein
MEVNEGPSCFMGVLKKLTKSTVLLNQQVGHFDEYLISLYSVAFGTPYIYDGTYSLYFDPLSKMLYISLFHLKEEADQGQCIETANKRFHPEKMVITSPAKLQTRIDEFHCITTYFDQDYQIHLPRFDETLNGHAYKDLRYRVQNAVKRGYALEGGRRITHAHDHIIACHEAKKPYAWWDLQLYLSVKDYLKQYTSPRLFNVFSKGLLLGFDVVDFLQDTMAVPLGFYLDYPSLADFILFKEIVYAKERSYLWLDLGWACNPGVEAFKRKWKAEPRFDVWTQEYAKTPVQTASHPPLQEDKEVSVG